MICSSDKTAFALVGSRGREYLEVGILTWDLGVPGPSRFVRFFNVNPATNGTALVIPLSILVSRN